MVFCADFGPNAPGVRGAPDPQTAGPRSQGGGDM
jgi:hypothetical protein